MTKEKLLENAKEELERIYVHSTATEWNRLMENIHRIEGDSSWKCVYGILTGYCDSPRAKELIILSAKPEFSPKLTSLNSNYKKHLEDDLGYGRNFSYLEVALFQYSETVRNYISEMKQKYSLKEENVKE